MFRGEAIPMVKVRVRRHGTSIVVTKPTQLASHGSDQPTSAPRPVPVSADLDRLVVRCDTVAAGRDSHSAAVPAAPGSPACPGARRAHPARGAARPVHHTHAGSGQQ